MKAMNNLPKNFVLQLGSLVALYVSVTALLTLIFSTVNIAFPDPAVGDWQWDSNQTSMRMSLALLIVFFPVYLWLTRTVNQARRQNDGSYATITKWMIYLSLFIGGLVMLIDLVVVIMTFLEGELTTRFILKAGAVLTVIGAVFCYYLKDARGYWQMKPQASAMYGAVGTAIVIGFVAASLYHLELPSEARERKLDTEQVRDLQEIQYRIEDYMIQNNSLPEDLAVLYEVNEPPTAPADRTPYRYEVTDGGFQLCAEFGKASRRDEYPYARPLSPTESDRPQIIHANDWEHEAGEWCFTREVRLPEFVDETAG